MAKPLKDKTITAALESMAEVLKNHAVNHPVKVQFPQAGDSHVCWEWRCHDEGGTQVCEWVKVPC
ncbi:MAG: hypothetical protein ABSH28_01075 [Acidobacteriota bacterium]|jgi:hypothetical protein